MSHTQHFDISLSFSEVGISLLFFRNFARALRELI